jgi:hypothetical protein
MLTPTQFAKQKIGQYQEPDGKRPFRKGAAGFSKVKYAAAVHLGLRDVQKKRLAQELGVSYGVLRNWWSENRFVELALQIGKEYANAFLDEVTVKFEKNYDESSDYYVKGGNIREPGPVDIESELAEWGHFNWVIRAGAYELLHERLVSALDESDQRQLMVNKLIQSKFFPTKSLRDFDLQMLKNLYTNIFTNLLAKKTIGLKEKRQIKFAIEMTQKFF